MRLPEDCATPPETIAERSRALAELAAVVDRLREPDGCPWDKKQTPESMARYLLEEGHELVEAIEAGDDGEATEEAGDLLMVVFMICRIAEEAGRFDLAAAARAVKEKLVRRHPHVFGDVSVEGADEVLSNWEAIKQREREDKEVDSSALAGLPKGLAALQRAERMCEKAAAAGFRWPTPAGALAKLDEEHGELHEALKGAPLDGSDRPRLEGELRERVEHELGDLLLSAAYLGHYLRIDPEAALRSALRRFEGRFRAMEGDGEGALAEAGIEELVVPK
ncbi:MAG: nucleoside triphosphate pyrophosphohydrolase, partial [Planctomycetes bacterium]|nr:nucleoside triphosphate pyrophosphohydrolase [Planctomycetota bacterium]